MAEAPVPPVAVQILKAFGVDPVGVQIERITTGHINQTFRVAGNRSFILQRINTQVFRRPDIIAGNLRRAAEHLARAHPGYLFSSSLPALSGDEMVYDTAGLPWRLVAYIPDTITVDAVSSAAEAREAASGFARLTANLHGCSASDFGETIPDFHNLSARYRQFEEALRGASGDRQTAAAGCIDAAKKARYLVDQYESLIRSGDLSLRVMHNDTKINNILFDRASRRAVCVIDLDTLGPGYFIYDLGDMVRTFVSPVSEEEQDTGKVAFRKEIYNALLEGYLAEMDRVLTVQEKAAIPFAGKMMTYIMALRFLADYLGGDVYYQTRYPGQNLVRAANQLRLLEVLEISVK